MTRMTFMKRLDLLSVLLLAVGMTLTASLGAEELRVSNQKQLEASIASAKPGDTIVMKDGIWRDAVIDFNASAKASARITLRAETPGKVILTGKSQLVFSKPYLIPFSIPLSIPLSMPLSIPLSVSLARPLSIRLLIPLLIAL